MSVTLHTCQFVLYRLESRVGNGWIAYGVVFEVENCEGVVVEDFVGEEKTPPESDVEVRWPIKERDERYRHCFSFIASLLARGGCV